MTADSPASTVEHVVLVQWAEGADAAARAEVRTLSQGLAARIPGIVTVTEGPSISPEGLEDGFDWALVIRFEDAAARDAYLPHPAHQPLAALIGASAARVIVFDVTV